MALVQKRLPSVLCDPGDELCIYEAAHWLIKAFARSVRVSEETGKDCVSSRPLREETFVNKVR